MAGPTFIRRTDIEGEMGVIELEIAIGVTQREWHGEAVKADVEVGIHRIAQWRSITIAYRRVVVGVGRSHGTSDDERVALGNVGDGLRVRRRARPAEEGKYQCA